MPKAPSAGRDHRSKNSKDSKHAMAAHIHVFRVEPTFAQGPLPQSSVMPPPPLRVPDTPDSGFTMSSRESTRSPANDGYPAPSALKSSIKSSKRKNGKQRIESLPANAAGRLNDLEVMKKRAIELLQKAETDLSELKLSGKKNEAKNAERRVVRNRRNLVEAEVRIVTLKSRHPELLYVFCNDTVDERTKEVVSLPEEVVVPGNNSPFSVKDASRSQYEGNNFVNVPNERHTSVSQEYGQENPQRIFITSQMHEQPSFVPAPTGMEQFLEYPGNQFSSAIGPPAVPRNGYSMPGSYPYSPFMDSQNMGRSESAIVSSDPRSMGLHQHTWDGYEYIDSSPGPFDEAAWYNNKPVASTSQAQHPQRGFSSYYQQRYAPY